MILTNRNYRNDIELISSDHAYIFKMFMRKSSEFIEDFSVGLIWVNPAKYINISKSIIMLRCQGPHDGKQAFEADIHHSFHTHEITVSDIEEKRVHNPSNRSVTKSFDSFESSLLYFVSKCNILGLDDAISMPSQQMSLY